MSDSRTHLRMSALALAICLPGAALFTGCTPVASDRPSVSWSSGDPSSAEDTSAWEEAIRAYALEWAIAFNGRDFTSPELAAVAAPAQISRLARELRTHSEDAQYVSFPGPLPVTILDVEEGDDTATVTVCQASTDWLVSEEHPEPSIADATEATYNLTRDEAGGIVVDSVGGSDRACDLSEAPIGLFDPQPDLTATFSPDDVKEP